MNKVIILLGQRVRSGTNFVGSTIAQHPDVITIPPDRSFGEFNLFNDDAIVSEVYQKVIGKSFASGITQDDLPAFLELYGKSWIDLMIRKFQIDSDQVIFLKSPNISQVDLWIKAFPKSPIGIICRDGRDNVISSVKASNDKRNWHNWWISLKKRINYYSGRSFINHSKEWNKTAMAIVHLETNKDIRLFKYESLLNSRENIAELLDHFQLDHNQEIIDKCLDAPIVGSSFGISKKGVSKPNWTPDDNKNSYQFTQKWTRWGLIKKSVFKRIAGKALINLEYEKNGNW